MTNHWVDIKNADIVLIMGGNAAEAHPCGFKWVTEAKAHNKARLIVVDPRFTRSASVADVYCPIRTGTDIAFLGGVMNYLLTEDKIQHEYVKAFTDMTFIVREDFAFANGLYSGFHADKNSYDKSSWEYEFGADGYVKVDPELKHPRCVYQLMKTHYARYTPEMVERVCGTPKEKFLQVCEMIGSTGTPTRAMTVMYALGWTQHSVGSQMIRAGAMMQLLLGNIGVAGGGMNALRGHSNIQGLTDLGLLSNLMPGYLNIPKDSEPTLADYMKTRGFKPLRPGQTSYWQNYKKFLVSLQKSVYGTTATEDNDWAYEWLPKLDVPGYDILRAFDMMNAGKINGYICQGFNPLQAFPNKRKIRAALGKLKFLVVMDPLETETARFWENHGEKNPSDPSKIATEVFLLPTTCFAEEDGSLTNSSRWLQWHWKAADAPGEARSDIAIMSGLFRRMRAMYQKDGGAFPDPILNLTWNYTNPAEPGADELAKEVNGKALVDVKDPAGAVLLHAGQQLLNFSQLRDDGTTACGCWVYSGCWTEAGNNMARRDATDPREQGLAPNWA